MDEKISSDLKSLKFIYRKNKSYILPCVIILASIFLFFQFVIPQFKALLAAQKEVKESSLKLEALKANLNVIVNVNEDVLDSQLKILNLALPLKKDFIGILDSINATALRMGVTLGNYSLQIGDISKSENGENFPVVKLSVPINSAVEAVNNFVDTISKTFPLAEVSSVKVGNLASSVSLSFYYKPLGVSSYSQDTRISPISQNGLLLIKRLSEFENTSSAVQ